MKHVSCCEIEGFVETLLCKLRGIFPHSGHSTKGTERNNNDGTSTKKRSTHTVMLATLGVKVHTVRLLGICQG